jgi:hypothetical protein
MNVKELIARTLVEAPLDRPRASGIFQQKFTEHCDVTLQELARKIVSSGCSKFCEDLPGELAAQVALRFAYDSIMEWVTLHDKL